MDPYSIFFTLILSSLFLLLVMIKTRKSKPNSFPLPPGPWKLPIIGSMHHLLGALPHRVFCDLSKKFGPVMHLKIGEVDHVIISSREAAKEIMKTNDLNFASRPDFIAFKTVTYGGTDIAFSPYGDYWRQLRKICTLELLSAKQVKSFTSLREEEVSKVVFQISSTGNSLINVSKMLLTLTNTVVTRATYGDKCRQQERFLSTIGEVSILASGFTIAELYPAIKFLDIVSRIKFKADRVHRKIDSIFDEIIREHEMKSHQGGGEVKEECLLDVLLRIKEHGDLEIPLTMDNVKAVIFDIFSVGTETSATLMDWTMVELMRNPKEMEKVQTEVRQILKGKEKIEGHAIEELNYLKMVIKETLRLHPPFPLLLPRICASTCEVAGYTIEAGSKIIINDWALGRDPRYWDDPESFIPERFEDINGLDFKGNSYEYLPFGSGRRICPGISFSQAIVELALAQLLFYFDWKLPQGMEVQDLDMTEAFGVSGRRESDLLLLATLHDAGAQLIT